MLENAGAIVYSPRERDWQNDEIIVDNDIVGSGYEENGPENVWTTAPRPGFSMHTGNYHDGENPFREGTARMAEAQEVNNTVVKYTPQFATPGKHAVYISYQTVNNSVDDAEYTVVHRGVQTKFCINQRMGGSTWVFLGTFDFGMNDPTSNFVMVTNKSKCKGGMVTTDAVKFGGGIGNIERGGRKSALPRAMEASRYWQQWAGAPYEVYGSKNGNDDYAEDLNGRSLFSNWLSYGSPYNPVTRTDTIATDTTSTEAKPSYIMKRNATAPDMFTGHVPIEMTLGVHSDAGYVNDKVSYVGSLAICTTDFYDGLLQNGMPRTLSHDLASQMLNNVVGDLKYRYSKWTRHDFFNRNYSETRLPAQPSAILETLSHQNFPDIRMGHDPEFKFWLSRAVYKTIVRFLAKEHGYIPIIQPLAPKSPRVSINSEGIAKITWEQVNDDQESTATPTSYNLYMAVDGGDFDNGTNVNSNSVGVKLDSHRLYRFRITQVNAGGESFPSEEVVALYNPETSKRVLIINGFHRLAAPETIDTDSIQGFDLLQDVGLSYGKTVAWCGLQKNFSTSQAGKSLGSSTNELMGRIFAGNDFNYATTHAEAIAMQNRANIESMSSEVIDNPTMTCDHDTNDHQYCEHKLIMDNPSELLKGYDFVDIVLGNERDDGYSLRPSKTFSVRMQEAIKGYLAHGGRVMASGSHIGSDMKSNTEKEFLANTFGIKPDTINVVTDPFTNGTSICEEEIISGFSMHLPVYRKINDKHYASHHSDVLLPIDDDRNAVLRYYDGSVAGVLGERTIIMGFPFECIKSASDRQMLMLRILALMLPE